MSGWVTGMGVTLLLLIGGGILLWYPLRIAIAFEYLAGYPQLHVDLRFLRIFHYSYHKQEQANYHHTDTDSGVFQARPTTASPEPQPTVPSIAAAEGLLNGMRTLADRVERFWPLLHRLILVFEVRRFSWTTTVGVADAPMTAWTCGVFWAVQGMLTGVLSQVTNMVDVPELEVIPRFDQACFESRLSCIVSGALGKAIFVGLKLFLLYKKGGAYAGTSNSIIDADSDGEPTIDG